MKNILYNYGIFEKRNSYYLEFDIEQKHTLLLNFVNSNFNLFSNSSINHPPNRKETNYKRIVIKCLFDNKINEIILSTGYGSYRYLKTYNNIDNNMDIVEGTLIILPNKIFFSKRKSKYEMILELDDKTIKYETKENEIILEH